MSTAVNLLSRYPIISDQVDRHELMLLLEALERRLVVGLDGAVVECGCYVGTSSLFIRRLLNAYQSDAEFHVYDSFAGLPSKTAADLSPAGEQFVTGALFASKKALMLNFKKAGLRPPIIHKGWFHELGSSDMPSRIGFAFLDGDYYESIRDSLRLVWPALTPGAIVVIDDYANEALPGAAQAVDEWLAAHPARLTVSHSLAIIET